MRFIPTGTNQLKMSARLDTLYRVNDTFKEMLKMVIQKITTALVAFSLAAAFAFFPASKAEAGDALKGAIIGAGVGGLVDGKDGAKKGAVAGGLAGAILG